MSLVFIAILAQHLKRVQNLNGKAKTSKIFFALSAKKINKILWYKYLVFGNIEEMWQIFLSTTNTIRKRNYK